MTQQQRISKSLDRLSFHVGNKSPLTIINVELHYFGVLVNGGFWRFFKMMLWVQWICLKANFIAWLPERFWPKEIRQEMEQESYTLEQFEFDAEDYGVDLALMVAARRGLDVPKEVIEKYKEQS